MQEFREEVDESLEWCGHGEQWLARDRRWRCEVCTPPTPFELEHDGVLARREVSVQLQLKAA